MRSSSVDFRSPNRLAPYECEAPDQGDFETWLRPNEWEADEICRVSFVHEEGQVWPMRL